MRKVFAGEGSLLAYRTVVSFLLAGVCRLSALARHQPFRSFMHPNYG
jgi:hypothetical protein